MQTFNLKTANETFPQANHRGRGRPRHTFELKRAYRALHGYPGLTPWAIYVPPRCGWGERAIVGARD